MRVRHGHWQEGSQHKSDCMHCGWTATSKSRSVANSRVNAHIEKTGHTVRTGVLKVKFSTPIEGE